VKPIDSPRTGYYALLLTLFGRSGAQPGWRVDAACAGHDPDLFTDETRTEQARAVCTACPVRTPCLSDHLAWEQATSMRRANRVGVVGGLTATERHRLSISTKRTNNAA
jgi:hypothetical protein